MENQICWIAVIFSWSLIKCSASSVRLEQIIPEENTPVCVGDDIAYRCITNITDVGRLFWEYSEISVGYTENSINIVGQFFTLGSFEVVLDNISTNGLDYILTSTARTKPNGLSANDSGNIISCFGLAIAEGESKEILFAEPIVSNESVCCNIIYWTPPPCDANCSISVDGEAIANLSCSDRILVTDSDLRNKMVLITATDQLGSSPPVPINMEDCIIPPTDKKETITLSRNSSVSSASLCGPVSVEYVYNVEDWSGGSAFEVFKEGTDIEIEPEVNASHLTFPGECGETYEIKLNGTVVAIVEPLYCKESVNHAACGFFILFVFLILFDAMVVVFVVIIWIQRKRKHSISQEDVVKLKVIREKSSTEEDPGAQNNVGQPMQPQPSAQQVPSSSSKTFVVDGKPQVYTIFKSPITHCKISPDDNFVAIADAKGIVRILRCGSGDVIKKIKCRCSVLSLEWVEVYGEITLVIGSRSRMKILSVEANNIDKNFDIHRYSQVSRMLCVAHCVSKSTFAVSCLTVKKNADDEDLGQVIIDDGNEKAVDKHFLPSCSTSPVSCMVFNYDGTQLVTGNWAGTITIFGVTEKDNKYTTEHLCKWITDHGIIYNVQYKYDEQGVYSMGKDGVLCHWSTSLKPKIIKIDASVTDTAESGEERLTAQGQLFCFLSRGKYLLTSSCSQGIIYKLKIGKDPVKVCSLPSCKAHITCVDWKTSGSESVCVMGCADNSVYAMKLDKEE